jgi:hypothetical protein
MVSVGPDQEVGKLAVVEARVKRWWFHGAPSFTERMQIGIVVRDFDAAARRYEDDYVIGPWGFHQFKPGDVKRRPAAPPGGPSGGARSGSSPDGGDPQGFRGRSE